MNEVVIVEMRRLLAIGINQNEAIAEILDSLHTAIGPDADLGTQIILTQARDKLRGIKK